MSLICTTKIVIPVLAHSETSPLTADAMPPVITGGYSVVIWRIRNSLILGNSFIILATVRPQTKPEAYYYTQEYNPMLLLFEDKDNISISNTEGDVFGVGVSGPGNIIGKDIVVGNGTINVDVDTLSKIESNEYAESLKDFSQAVNNRLKGLQVKEEQVNSINQDVDDLAKEVQDIKPDQQKVDYIKKIAVESKTATLIQRVLSVLPQTAEVITTFTPLAPFSKLLGKGVKNIVEAIQKSNSNSNTSNGTQS
jgi:hypothetical protein